MSPLPTNEFDLAEDISRDLYRAETLARHAGHAAWNAGNFEAAAELLAEASRLTFSESTEMERAA